MQEESPLWSREFALLKFTVRVPRVSSLAAIVVLLSVKKTKRHLPRPPSVCPTPLTGLCWFNPGGQQADPTAPRHYRVIYGELRAQRRWPLRFDPCCLISHASRGREVSDSLSFTDPKPCHPLVTRGGLGSARRRGISSYAFFSLSHYS